MWPCLTEQLQRRRAFVGRSKSGRPIISAARPQSLCLGQCRNRRISATVGGTLPCTIALASPKNSGPATQIRRLAFRPRWHCGDRAEIFRDRLVTRDLQHPCHLGHLATPRDCAATRNDPRHECGRRVDAFDTAGPVGQDWQPRAERGTFEQQAEHDCHRQVNGIARDVQQIRNARRDGIESGLFLPRHLCLGLCLRTIDGRIAVLRDVALNRRFSDAWQ